MLRVRNHNDINKYLEMKDRSRFIQTETSLNMSTNNYNESKLGIIFSDIFLFCIYFFLNDPLSQALKILNK